jgi:hypothetical protein
MIYLTKIDPVENEARFHVLDVQPTVSSIGMARQKT